MEIIESLENEVESCINCGFCEAVCPTLEPSGFRSAIGARGRVDIAKIMLAEISEGKPLSIDPRESFYSCLDCHACLQVCPAGVNAGKVSALGREILTSGEIQTASKENRIARMIVDVTMKYENPLGLKRECAKWAEGLSFDKNSRTLLYTGNMYQLMAYSGALSRLQDRMGANFSSMMSGMVSEYPGISRVFRFFKNKEMETDMNNHLKNIYHLLRQSGISFSYMGEDEPYPGTFINDLGYRKEFIEYAQRLIKKFSKMNIERIIVVDPHTYDLFIRRISELLGPLPFEVIHYLDLVNVDEGKKSSQTITFHEPCHLTLRNPSYNRPLELLRGVADVKMPARSGKKLMCCGGPDELLFGKLSKKVSEERLRQLNETGAQRIVTACPICLANLGTDSKAVDISTFLSKL